MLEICLILFALLMLVIVIWGRVSRPRPKDLQAAQATAASEETLRLEAAARRSEELMRRLAAENETMQRFLPLKSMRSRGGSEIRVVGVMDYQGELDDISEADADGAVKRMQTGALKAEPGNPYDENAVQVIISEQVVGYLSAAKAEKYQPIVLRAEAAGMKITCDAEIVGGFIKDDGEQANFGVRLNLASPAELSKMLDERMQKAGQPAEG